MPADFLSLYLPNLLLILSVFIVGAASPGPATLMIMNVSAREGRAAGVMLSLGIVTGSVFWALVAALGFVAALKTSVLFFTAMKNPSRTGRIFRANEKSFPAGKDFQ